MTAVPVSWAVLGKEQDTYDDYSITAGGNGLSRAHLPDIFDELSSLGEPPEAASGPQALPWIVFTAARTGRQDYVGLSVQDWTAHSDALGRPIMACTYYYVPYGEASDRGASYRDILAAVRNEPLPGDGTALTAVLNGTAPESLAATVADLGFERVAGAAALLLQAPVTVTGAEHLTLEQRLAFMDAVAALLPQGWRIRYSAATWHEGHDTRIMLAFGPSCRPGSFELHWHDPGAPPAASRVSAAYHGWLHELVGRRGWTTARLIAGLAAHRTPMFDDGPDAAVEVLKDLDWPETVRQAVEKAAADRDDLVRLFALGRHQEYGDAATTAKVFDALVDKAEPADLPLVARLWHPCGGRPEPLVRNVRRRLWREDPEPDLDAYASAADRLGVADVFFAGLLTAPRRPSERPGGEAVLAELLREHRPLGGVPALEALGAHGSVLAELLLAITSGPVRDRRDWLAAVTPYAPAALLDAFRALWDRRPLSPETFGDLVPIGQRCTPAVLHAAARRKELAPALDAFGAWLTAAKDAVDSGYLCDPAGWAGVLAGLRPATSAEKGAVDALLLRLGDEPRHLVECGAARTYFETFHALCTRPDTGEVRAPFLSAMQSFLARYGWVADRAPATIKLVRIGFDADPVIARTVLLGRSLEPGLARVPAFVEWRRRALTVHPRLKLEEPLLLVGNIRPDAPPEVVGALCAEALLGGVGTRQVREQVIAAGWRFDGEGLVRMLDEVVGSLMRARRRRSEAVPAALKLGRELLRSCTPDQSAKIQQHVVWYTLRETDYRMDMLWALAGDPKQRGSRLDRGTRGELLRLSRIMRNIARPPRWPRG